MPRLPLATIVLIGMSLTACSGSSSPSAPSPSPTSTVSPTPTVADQLAGLAATGVQASYTATYRLQARHGQRAARLVVNRTPTAFRIDIVQGNVTATLLHTGHGTFACRRQPHQSVHCFTAGRAGRPIPQRYAALFQAGQEAFTTYPQAFAAHAADYSVSAAPGTTAHGRVPAGTCFHVTTAAGSPVASGTYCLAVSGVPTAAVVRSGTLTLLSVHLGTPAPKRFTPPAHPTPLPGV